MLFVPDIFALERTNGIEEILNVLMLTIKCWVTKRGCPTCVSDLYYNFSFYFY